MLLIALRYRRKENLSLALLLLVYSLRLGTIPTWNAPTMLANPWLLPLVTPLPFLFGPLLWRYVHAIADDSGVRTAGGPIWHALPYLLDLAFTIGLVLQQSPAEYAAMISAIFRGNPPVHLTVRNGLKVLFNVIYVALAVRLAFRKSPTADVTAAQRLWLKALVIAPVVSLVLFGFVALQPQATAGIARGVVTPFIVLAAAMALLVYVFSFLMLAAPEVPSACGCDSATKASAREISEEDRDLAERVMELLDAHIFRDPDLTMETMARELRTHPTRLSRVINCVLRESFSALIQRYRVRYFIARGRSGDLEHRTILDLAFDVGFSSKSTFNRVFKAETGMSPSRFKTVVKSGCVARGDGSDCVGHGIAANSERRLHTKT